MENTPVFQEDVTASIDVVLQDKLEKANITELTLSELRNELQDLAKIQVTDKKQLALVQGGITKAVNIRNNIVRICKKGREAAIMEQRAWIAKEKELVAVVAAAEAPLVALKEAYNAEQERIEAERREAQERAIRERLVAIEGFGFSRRTGLPGADDYYTNGQTSVLIPTITGSSDAEWSNLIRGIEMAWQEEQDRAAAEAERLRQEQEAIAERERKLAEERAELDRREKAMADAIRTIRKNELLAMGCVETEGIPGYKYMNVVVPAGPNGRLESIWSRWCDVLNNYADDEWQRVIADAKESLQKAAEIRAEAEAAAEKLRIQQELERVRTAELQEIGAHPLEYPALPLHQYDASKWPEEVRMVKVLVDKRIAEEKAEKDRIAAEAVKAELKRQAQEAARREAEEKERMDKLSDVERWDEWMQAIENSAPTLVSAQGQHAVNHLIHYIKEKYSPSVRLELKR